MDWRVLRLTQELQKHDPLLYAEKTNSGMIQVWRKAEKWSAIDVPEETRASLSIPIQFILPLTDDWTLTGKPVEWGIEPVMSKVLEMDSWQDDSKLDQIRKKRERVKTEKEQSNKNEMKARAYDMRRDFARATNEINTSTMEKVDARRTYGNC